MATIKLSLRWVLGCFCVFLFMATSCNEPDLPAVMKPDSEYLFLSHTRSYQNLEKAAQEIETLNFDKYDVLLLGGDLTARSSRSASVLTYIDSVFDVSSPRTLWAMGNHDYGNPSLVETFTKRPTFYSFNQNQITFIVLDTERNNCSIQGDQLTFFKSVLDTLNETRQLVIIHHKLIWMPDHPEMEPLVDSISNWTICSPQSFCLFRNNFYPDIYPLLIEVQNKGIPVTMIGGDTGYRTSFYSFKTSHGIQFLANGMREGKPDSKGLVLIKNGETGELTWELKGLDEI